MSLRKRAAKMLIARRAFLSLTFIQATLHAYIPACDFTFPKFNRITVYFCSFSLLHRTFPQIKNARPCDLYSRFVRAITRFQRNFSVNSAQTIPSQRIFSVNPGKVSVKSAQIQEVSVNNHLPYIMMPAHCGKATVGGHSAFSDGLESLADDLAGVDNSQKGLRVLPAQEIP